MTSKWRLTLDRVIWGSQAPSYIMGSNTNVKPKYLEYVCLPACLLACLSVCLPASLSLCLTVCMSVSLSPSWCSLSGFWRRESNNQTWSGSWRRQRLRGPGETGGFQSFYKWRCRGDDIKLQLQFTRAYCAAECKEECFLTLGLNLLFIISAWRGVLEGSERIV